MLQSKLFPKTKKEAPKDAESINHKLLVRAGFTDQLMAGSWTLLPLIQKKSGTKPEDGIQHLKLCIS